MLLENLEDVFLFLYPVIPYGMSLEYFKYARGQEAINIKNCRGNIVIGFRFDVDGTIAIITYDGEKVVTPKVYIKGYKLYIDNKMIFDFKKEEN